MQNHEIIFFCGAHILIRFRHWCLQFLGCELAGGRLSMGRDMAWRDIQGDKRLKLISLATFLAIWEEMNRMAFKSI